MLRVVGKLFRGLESVQTGANTTRRAMSTSRTGIQSPAKLHHMLLKSPKKTSKSLVVLHGILGNCGQFRGLCNNPQIRNLADIYLVDLRNHGKSEFRDTMSPKEMADDILGFIQEMGIEHPIVMGHSLGGKVAAKVALQAPSTIGGLIMVDMAPVNYAKIYNEETQKQPRKTYELLQMLQNLKLKGRTMDDVRTEVMGKTKSTLVTNFLLGNLGSVDAEHTEPWWKVNLSSMVSSYNSIATENFEGTYPGKVKVIAGGASDYVPKGAIPKFQEIFPAFNPEQDLVYIPGAGHWLHFEKPYVFIEEVSKTLASV